MQPFLKQLGQLTKDLEDKWGTALIIALTLMASITAGLYFSGIKIFGGSGFQMTILGGIVILLGGAPIGVAALYATSFLATWFNFGTPGLTFLSYLGPWMGIVLFLAGIVILSKGRLDRVLERIRACWGFPFLIAYVVSGLILAPIFYDNPVEHIGWTFMITLAVMCLSIVITLPPDRVFKITSRLLFLAFWVMFVLFAYFSFFTSGTVIFKAGIEFNMVHQVVGAANDSAGLLITLLPFGLVLLTGRRYFAVIRWAVLLLAAYFVYRSFTRMAWIDLPVVLCVYFWILGKKRLVVTLAIVVILIALYSTTVNSLFLQILQSGGVSSSANNTLAYRIYVAWLPMIRFTLQKWQTILIGSGDATYWISPYVPLQGGMPVMPHNLWVERFVSRGVLGVVLWLLYMLAIPMCAIKAMLALSIEKRAWFAAGMASWVGYNIYALSANAQVDVYVITNILVGVCLWAYAQSVKTNHGVFAKVDESHG